MAPTAAAIGPNTSRRTLPQQPTVEVTESDTDLRRWHPEPAERGPPLDADSADSPSLAVYSSAPPGIRTRPRYRLSAVTATPRPAIGQVDAGGFCAIARKIARPAATITIVYSN